MNALRPARVAENPATSLLAPSALERLMRLKGDLRLGLPVVLTGDSMACLVVPLETLSVDRYAALMAGGAAAQVILTRNRAAALDITDLPETDVVAFPLPVQLGLEGVLALADPTRAAPRGMVHPVERSRPRLMPGNTIHHAAIALAKSSQLLPAALVLSVEDGLAEAVRHGLSIMEAGVILAELTRARVQHPVASARLPMAAHETGRVHVYRPDDGGIEHYAIEIGTPDRTAPVLVRLHSACFTGDVLGSLKCDCGPQLHAATAAMAEEGGGVLLYLNQEGRGIGLANKMRAYALQDQGFDTVEANHHLGFDDDERDFRIGSALLARLGIAAVRLLTNNPAKVAMLQAQGITVAERVPLQVGQTAQNARYLATKAAKSGHLLK
ncbi:GTP cyclohydrolase II [Seohaeicola sp. SP36]|uniref:GTP cyclohydrolase II n=1 Tax=unclassified Seohaeicola TaxID=2641111 RepID=UPI003D80AAA1